MIKSLSFIDVAVVDFKNKNNSIFDDSIRDYLKNKNKAQKYRTFPGSEKKKSFRFALITSSLVNNTK